MSHSVEMPALGESVTEGTITRWLKQEGDSVEVDEPLLEVSTDKVDTEIPSPAAGVLQKIVVAEDETVEVGAQLALIGDGAESGGGDDAPADSGSDESDGSDDDTEAAEAEPQPASDAQAEPAQAEPAQAEPAQAESAPAAEQDSGGGDGTPVTMPALGESVTEGTVTRWLKQVGDSVEVDEPLLEVSTDKVDTEIPSPVAGTVLQITVGEDETAEVGAQLAVVGSGDAGDAGGGGQAGDGGTERAEQAATADEEAEEVEAEGAQEQEPEQQAEQEPTPSAEASEREQPAAGEAEQREASAGDEPPAQQQPAQQQPAQQAQQSAQQAQQPAQQAQQSDAGGNGQPTSPYVTPLVRKLATEHDVDLSAVQGTGVGGRIRKQDVLAVVEERQAPASEPEAPAEQPAAQAPARSPKPQPEPSRLRGRTEKMSRLRKVIATRMRESLHVSAQLTTVTECDVTRIARLRDRAKDEFAAREGVRLSFLPFFAKATVEALKHHPRVNASIDEDAGEITYHGAEHLGVAVDTERGLLVPVIHDAGDLNIAGLARRIADVAERTRANQIKPDELGGGTFTLTNTGSRGALFDTPIINQPQVGILGTGSVVKRPVVVPGEDGDTLAIRSMMYLALSYDHRLVDGADAARFLVTVKERLEEGAFEADLGL